MQDLKSGRIDKAEGLRLLKARRDGAAHGPAATSAEVGLYAAQWREQPLEPGPEAAGGDWLVLLSEPFAAARATLAALPAAPRCQVFARPEGDLGARYEALAVQVLAALQAPLREPLATPLRVQLVIPAALEDEPLFGLAALLRSVEQENPRIRAQVIGVDPERVDAPGLASLLDAERAHHGAAAILHRDGTRSVLHHAPLPAAGAPVPWRDDGVYLLTGGAGGLGALFAREILHHAPGARVVLAARSDWSDAARAALAPLGPGLQLRRLDVSDAAAVEALLRDLHREHGTLTGILHAAGTLRDGFALGKSAADLAAVCAPKVRGLLNLERASRGLPVEFLASFSSLAGVLGNVGQSDYALANAFLDRRALQTRRSISIAWPLWREGGMRIDAQTERALRENLGLAPIDSERGFAAFYQALAAARPQVLVACGDLVKLAAGFDGATPVAAAPALDAACASISAAPEAEAAELRAALLARLKALFSECTRYRVEELDALEPLERYGIDSIMITRLNQRLAALSASLPKTLLYEHRTLAALAGYLLDQHAAASRRWAGLDALPAASARAADADAADTADTARGASSAVAAARAPAEAHDDAIAIIGLSGRYPHAASPTEFWNNLRDGLDCIGEIPPERWPLEGFYEADRKLALAQGKSYGKWGGFLDGFADFDPLFFGISPREASGMDPQERLFMQACWDVLEDAAISRETLATQYGGRVGVYAGITKTGFNLYGPALWRDGETLHPRTSFSSVANRVSYTLNLNGPSLPFDTMCSSSLTAIHEACRALRAGDCELAIAGGVNLYLHPSSFVELSASQMLSSDGRCKSFGEGGNGFVPGEGVGAVLLKPLAQAQADGDPIHAVILATQINHGGKTHGYTVPNPSAQRDVVRAALDRAGIDARSIGFVEAHGTGTEMGDPIEIEGLTQAFRGDTDALGYCAIGSVKSNIGHLEAAAGIAGLTKVVMQMKHRQLVPSLNADVINPNIDFERTPFVLQRTGAAWRRMAGPRGEWPLRAGISSFGAGGANAHVIVEEFVPLAQPARAAAAAPSLVVLSARTEAALRGRIGRLLSYLSRADRTPAVDLAPVIAERLAGLLHVAPAQIEADVGFSDYGVGEFELRQLLEQLAGTAGLAVPDDAWRDCGSVAELAACLQPATVDGARLEDIAYTLQVGRESMEWRLACVAGSLAELTTRLEQYLAGDVGASGVHAGQAAQGGEEREALARRNQPAVEAALAARELGTLASLWVAGQRIEWAALHRDARPRRMHLPSYPYARNTYWIAERYRGLAPASVVPQAASVEPEAPSVEPQAPSAAQTREYIERIVLERLCASLDLRSDEVRADQSFADYGLDSILGVELVDGLNARLGLDLDTTCLFDHSTLQRLVEHLVSQYKEPVAAPDAPRAPAVAAGAAAATPAAAHEDAIAIVGISGRFGRSDDLDALWEHLAQGHDLIEPVTRWPLPADAGEAACRHGSFVEGIAEFDPLFFNISGLEATYMDPQQRHFLQEAWKALENAGYAGAQVAGTDCGVYVGCCGGDYQDLFLGKPSPQSLWGNMASVIPSRIAYYLDLKGPSMAIDSACSSSLVAIDLACKDLRSGETRMALAGGVFLQATPKLYTAAHRAGMLSATGRCHTFDASADGFVPGEGVGVLVLKRLADALADGDHVHGVIRGSGVNQDGTTNGITAPSARSQEALLRRIYERFGIDAGEIGMVEAHGTGTRLGDPIEFGALTRAFRADTERREYCAIGSLKTNLGHTQYAAGVAGVLKILLALEHEQIPPSLHYRSGNPAIRFADSPFYVNTRLQPWAREAQRPRLAAVSSFGAGGTNAHLVIGEAPHSTLRHADRPAWLVTLSARTSGQLRQQIERLRAHCLRKPSLDLGNLSFTLLAGRKHFGRRAAWVVSDLVELAAALGAALDTGREMDRESSGNTAPAAGAAPARAWEEQAAALAAAGSEVEYRAALGALADAYLQGAEPQWRTLYADGGYRRMPLPTYPFARERYWLDAAAMTLAPDARPIEPGALPAPAMVPAAISATTPAASAHPWLAAGAVGGGRPSLRTRFSGREFFVVDHVVQGRTIMPGVVSLELARAAFAAVTGKQTGVEISDVVWVRPFVTGEPMPEVQVDLLPDTAGRYEFRVRAAGDAEFVYTQGFVQAGSGEPAALDLAAWQARCTSATVSRERCYDAIRAMGIDHGPSLRAIDSVRTGAGLALARLVQPAGAQADGVVLHPALLDAAIQASIALLMGENRTALPFALRRLDVLAPCVGTLWAAIRLHEPRAGWQELDIELCDEAGAPCARLSGYSSRILAPRPGTDDGADATSAARGGALPAVAAAQGANAVADGAAFPVLLQPVWDVTPLPAAARQVGRLLVIGAEPPLVDALRRFDPELQTLAFVADESRDALVARLAALRDFDQVVWVGDTASTVPGQEDALLARQPLGVLRVFRLIKALLAAGRDEHALHWTLLTTRTHGIDANDAVQPAEAGLHGLFGSLAREYPNWPVRVIDLDTRGEVPLQQVFELPFDAHGDAWLYRGGQWYRRQCVPLVPQAEALPSYREGGVYVVIGGAGGVGGAWSEALVQDHRAQIVWLGRSAADARIEARLDALAAHGPRPLYLSADACELASLRAARDEVLRRFGRIDGVLHSAIVLQDRTLARMDEQAFLSSYRVKADVSVRMAQVFGELPLDFMLFFSSIQSFARMPGQANYAAGCVFKDAFATYLDQTRRFPVRIMNWGYWGEVGVAATADYQARMARAGIASVEPPEAMTALDVLLTGPSRQLALIKVTRLSAMDGTSQGEVVTAAAAPLPALVATLPAPAADAGVASLCERVVAQTAEMDHHLARLLYVQLREFGLFGAEGATLAGLRARLPAMYERWLDETLTVLQGHGWIARHADGAYHALRPVDAAAAWADWERDTAGWLSDDNRRSRVQLVEAMLRALPEILGERRPATAVMFPKSSLKLVEGVYKNNPVSDHFNAVLVDVLVAWMKARVAHDPAARVRILEVGAGTGGTSARVFPALRPYQDNIAEYCYTDLSKAFLMHAQREFGPANPYLAYRLFDAGKPLDGQGIDAQAYDVVIATNVLHATANIRNTLRNVKATLRPNGVLLLNEMSDNLLFSHLTFGLLEGWWLYDDPALRLPGSPGLYPEVWQAAMEAEGFRSVRLPAASARALAQQIIVGESDGLARQPVGPGSPVALRLPARAMRRRVTFAAGAASSVARASVSVAPRSAAASAAVDSAAAPAALSRGAASDYLRELVAEVIRIPAAEIDPAEPLESYGIDSVLVVQLTARLRSVLPNIGGTLLFEVATIDALSERLLSTHAEPLGALLSGAQAAAPVAAEASGATGTISEAVVPVVAAAAEPVVTVSAAAAAASADTGGDAALRAGALDYLRGLVAEVIRIPATEIDPAEPLESYGIDSVLVVQLTARLRSVLPNIGGTLLFEVTSVAGLAERLLVTHAPALRALVAGAGAAPVTATPVEAHAPAAPEAAVATPPGAPVAPAPTAAALPVAPPPREDIAIIGLSGRYPKAENVRRFWENLRDGRHCIGEIPAERWNWRDYFDEQKGKEGAMYSKYGGFLDDFSKFDPLFFRISPAEAERMDPQERQFLMQAHAVIEDAGYTPAQLADANPRMGVFVGIMNGRYATSAAYWSAANRVSYLFNFTGPSLAVDTACSSSLTALHLAVESLHSGASDCAIAGGVNLISVPQHYITLSEMVMLTPSDKCHSFGAGAQGFVDGEGVGAVLLKPLSRAIADGDHIYGLIKGTAINAGGKTHSYTVPSPTAQAALVRTAFERAGIDPRTVSYVEAHGTGTSLGDPIEISGLTRAFGEHTADTGFCAIGSVKSNIGHAESAAGIAGLTKVLMQMKHRQIAPSLHAETVNPEIDFAATPFVLQQALGPWERPVIDGREVPLRAGISSFGAGGANAHVIVEEYLPARPAAAPALADAGPHAVLLSARDADRLREMAQALHDVLGEPHAPALADLAHTLQVGRVALDQRLAFVAGSLEEARDKLAAYLAGRHDEAGLWLGRRETRRGAATARDEGLPARCAAWAAERRYEALLPLWVSGTTLDWAAYGLTPGARRVSLPTYVFAREHFWLTLPYRPGAMDPPRAAPVLHPLLHANTSNLDGLRLSARLRGEEFFLADHVVQGRRVLPGVAYLEMARAALTELSPAPEGAAAVLTNVVWSRPFALDDAPASLHIGLVPHEDGRLAFSIHSDAGVHSQGSARWDPAPVAETLDLDALRASMGRAEFSPAQCYDAFAELGLAYGPGHRGLAAVYAGEDAVLARLALPVAAPGGVPAFVLHPGVMDSALQASVAFLLGEDGSLRDSTTVLPFAAARVEALAPCVDDMWVWVRREAGSSAASAVQKLEFVVCDAQGAVCARILGFAARRFAGQSSAGGSAAVTAAPGLPDADAELASMVLAGESAVTSNSVADLPAEEIPLSTDTQLHERTERYLKSLLANATRMAAEQITPDVPFEEYGLDSIMVIKLTSELEKHFGALSKTLFFEYGSLAELAGYFVESHAGQLDAVLGSSRRTAAAVPAPVPAAPAPARAAPAALARQVSRAATPAREPLAVGDVAIIGLAGRYPMAADVDAFWDNLRAGRDCVSEVPAERWDHAPYYSRDRSQPGTVNSKWGGFIDGVDEFDPLFFNISPRDAEIIDPQERVFLQNVFHTFEDAGYTRQSLARAGSQVGVFVGVMYEEYQLYGAEQSLQGRRMALSGSQASIANRVSYYFDLRGPSLALDTMCSSSLTAIHLACQSLRDGECTMAIAGGVNLTLHPNKYLALGQGKFVSSKGRCEAFGDGGDGYVPSEGVGSILLKPLAQAEADRDHIYGVIKASAVNHGGKTNAYTVPNPGAQAEVIARSLERAGVDARTISYIEAHGTGTSLGDPIEITGLSNSFRRQTRDTGFCAIGSVKSNIGHCESAAGIAGVTKVLLQMRHRELVPSLHSARLNPHIDFAATPFVVQQQLAAWERPCLEVDGELLEYPLRAGVSSFGAGGANAHVLIEEYQGTPQAAPAAQGPALVVLSARNPEQLREVARRLSERLALDQPALADLAFTLQTGREAMDERLGLVVGSVAELRERLDAFLSGDDAAADLHRGNVRAGRQTLAAFSGDDDLRDAIHSWIAKGKFDKLLAMWVQGLAMDWTLLHGGAQPHRVSLPGYPFAKTRFWVPGLQAGQPAPAAAVAVDAVPAPVATVSAPRSTVPAAAVAQPAGATLDGVLLARPQWVDQPLAFPATAPTGGMQQVLLYALPDIDAAALANRLGDVRCETLQAEGADAGERFMSLSRQLFATVRGILQDKRRGETLLQLVLPAAGEAAAFAGLSGLLSTAQLENPRIRTQVVLVADGIGLPRLAGLLRAERAQMPARGQLLRYRGSRRELASLVEIAPAPAAAPVWRDKGVVLITGGAGAIGLVFARAILAASPASTVVLTGRSQLDGARLAALEALGPRVVYRSLDVVDASAVQALVEGLSVEFGPLTAVLHGAGFLRDAYLLKKSEADFVAVLEPKVRGLVNLDLATRAAPLDVFATFASLAGVTGNPGQADYTTGNAFMDHYMAGRELQVRSGERQGRSLSLDWPLWADGGMRPDEASVTLMFDNFGLATMDDATGIAAFDAAFASAHAQVLVATGDRRRLIDTFGVTARKPGVRAEVVAAQPAASVTVAVAQPVLQPAAPLLATAAAQPVSAEIADSELLDRLLARLREQVASLIKVEPRLVEFDAELSDYGYDSVSLTDLADRLNREFGLDLTPALFFEFPTLQRMAEHLLATQRTPLAARLAPAVAIPAALAAPAAPAVPAVPAAPAVVAAPVAQSPARSPAQSGAAPAARDAAISATELRDRVGAYLREQAAALIKVEADVIDLDCELSEYGYDSISLTDLADRVNRELGLELTPALFFEYPSLQGLAGHLVDAHAALLTRRFAPATVAAPIHETPAPAIEVEAAVAAREPDLAVAASAVPVGTPGAVGAAELRDRLCGALRERVAGRLHVVPEQIELGTALSEYGYDSVQLTELTNELNAAFGFALTPALFFEFPTLQALAEYLLRTEQERLTQVWPTTVMPLAEAAPAVADTVVVPAAATPTAAVAAAPAPMQDSGTAHANEAIAIVGLSACMPMAEDADAFWQNLLDGRDCVTEIPAARWDWRAVAAELAGGEGGTRVKWGAFIDGVDEFDPLFFGISPREALVMDPQQRLLMTYVWKALEDAGYASESISGSRTALFVGTGLSGYQNLFSAEARAGEGYSATSVVPSVGPNRMSYFLNLHGPSEPIETACSSSLVAINRGITVLRDGSCEMAIVGGINTIVTPDAHVSFSKAGMLSEDGRCKTFSAEANGYVRGEGVGMLVLKRLSDAQAAGDAIYAVIRGG
ncbi:SDR family NAD(P)-dependent oxidoreductase, partial [Burkholderia gladioli]|uniref:SDR family NAD(P)-dependent oxidoreductase n=2 Tax=Burkholderia gladioli TaxID=28095 RepID=UPI00163E566A